MFLPFQSFEPLVDRVGVKVAKQQPVEFFVDKHLVLASKEEIKSFEVRVLSFLRSVSTPRMNAVDFMYQSQDSLLNAWQNMQVIHIYL